jgi:hypothetical protein
MEEVNKNTEIDNMDKKLHISDVIGCLTENQLNEIILHLHEYGTMTDKYCYGLPIGEEDMKQMRELIIGVLKNNR